MISKHAAFNSCTKFKACAACVKIINVQATKNAFLLKMLFQPYLENVTKCYARNSLVATIENETFPTTLSILGRFIEN